MKIAILAAGAGGMYCGSCMRDNALASGLKRLGHEVSLIPLYTPLRTEGDDASTSEIFYGGINVYLQHAAGAFRHTPRAIDWVFDRPWLLKIAGNLGAQTPPRKVADLTNSIIEGDQGAVRKELHRLMDYLKREVKPQVVSLPNLMFIGMAEAFARELKVPVVCELTGEDIFLDAMDEADREKMKKTIRARVGDVTRFVSTTKYYAGRMAEYLDIGRERIDVVPTGLSSEYFAPVNRGAVSRARAVGYMARICPEKGLHRLVEAMEVVRSKSELAQTRLVAAGYLGGRDQKWFDELKGRIDGGPLSGGFTFLGEVDRADKIAMLDSMDVVSVPASYTEAKGIYVLEALARGVPVVQPAHGSFVELIEQTGGGVLVPPGDTAALGEAIAELLKDEARRDHLGRMGRTAVELNFTEEMMAAGMVRVFEALL